MEEIESVLVIADGENQQFYHSLRLGPVQVTTTSCKRAVAALRKGGVDLLILDSGQDAEMGLPILRALKQEFASVPVIFLADLMDEEIANRVIRAGARNYFRKPASVSEVELIVLALLKLRRSCTETRESLRTGCLENAALHDLRLEPPLPVGLARAISSMHARLADHLCLDAVAREAGMSKYHFCRVFKHYCGTSPMRFLCWLRVERAKQLLERKDLKVASIAFSVGFKDLGEFNRQFKKVSGIAPSRYRSSCM